MFDGLGGCPSRKGLLSLDQNSNFLQLRIGERCVIRPAEIDVDGLEPLSDAESLLLGLGPMRKSHDLSRHRCPILS